MEGPEKARSSLYALEPIVRKLPEIEVPKRHIPFREKFMWTGLVLLLFLVMCQIRIYGMVKEVEPFFGRLQFVLASHAGTLMELGIGPIVTAGMVMQLLVGGRIIKLNLREPDDRALFTGVQKLAAIAFAAFHATMLVLGGWYGTIAELGWLRAGFIVAQLIIGAVLIIFLDELVSKFGLGSGVSLFIAAGVSTEVVYQGLSPVGAMGAIPNFISGLMSGAPGWLEDAFFRPGPNMMGLIAMLMIFLLVVYSQSLRVEIPLAYGRFGGLRGRYPIRFLYASVLPVILASVLFTNVRLVAGILQGQGFPILGTVDPSGTPVGGVVYYLDPPYGLDAVAADPIRAIVYFAVLVPLCMGFAWLWIYMSGMGPRDVARQLQDSGMLIPGFRRDVRIMEGVLSRYITTITLMGGAFVGILSASADFTGAIGTGTGILLTVSIVYELYQEIARERISEMFPAMRKLLGE